MSGRDFYANFRRTQGIAKIGNLSDWIELCVEGYIGLDEIVCVCVCLPGERGEYELTICRYS